jgi:TDG/mug DNA glycosylase family protein
MKTLPDHLRKGMKLVIVGCNPTESSVRTGHYYSGRENPFWPVLFETGVIPEPLEYRDDKRIIEFAIGLTDLVKRPTRSITELTREDYAEGRIVLSQKLGEFAPHVIAFNGKSVYEQFSQRRAKLGLQKDLLYGAQVYVLPATDSQHAQKPKDRIVHFRKLAALVKKVETSRDAKPAL